MGIPASKIKMKVLTLFLAAVLLAAPASAISAVPYDQFLTIEGYVVGGIDTQEYQELEHAEALEYVTLDIYVTEDHDYARSLLRSGIASYVEPNFRAAMLEDPTSSTSESSPNWVNRDLNTAYSQSMGLTGKGVRIALIDSGIDRNNLNLTQAVIEEGRNYYTVGKPVLDLVGHGSYVAQMIAGDGFDGAVRGVAPEATLVPLQAFDLVNGYAYSVTVAELAKCIVDAVQDFHCDVINMSWGLSSNYKHSAVEDAIQAAYSAGAILVSASGNTSSFPQYSFVYPAAYPEVISVGSYGEGRVLASTSIQNDEVTLAAPGHLISAFKANRGSEETTYSKQTITGTSFSSPAIAGIAALVKQYSPSITQEGVLQLFKERAVDVGEIGRDKGYGYGAVSTDVLFGQSWNRKTTRNGRTVLEGWLCETEPMTAIIATYEPSGRMVDCNLSYLNGELFSLDQFTAQQLAEKSVQFLLYDKDGNLMENSILQKTS